LAASKALTTAPILASFDRHAEVLTRQSAELFVSDEAREGVLSFLEKRSPRWVASTKE
jgi:enoyl-CoA hydratase